MISIQKPLKYCKVISLQLNKLIKKKRSQGAGKKKKKESMIEISLDLVKTHQLTEPTCPENQAKLDHSQNSESQR